MNYGHCNLCVCYVCNLCSCKLLNCRRVARRISRIVFWVFWVVFFKFPNIFQIIISIKLNSFHSARASETDISLPCPWRVRLTYNLHPKFSVKVKSFLDDFFPDHLHDVETGEQHEGIIRGFERGCGGERHSLVLLFCVEGTISRVHQI